MQTIAQPIDFVGVNAYTTIRVKSARFSLFGYKGVEPDRSKVECTDMGWEVAPRALYDILMWVHREYPGLRLMVTENGAAYPDVLRDGEVNDDARVSYLARHLGEVEIAVRAGCPIDGYFVWSLFDNLEWSHGYKKRFGIVYVDYPTQERIIKKSGHWYRDVCRRRGVTA
jgi:beta-glucosidase